MSSIIKEKKMVIPTRIKMIADTKICGYGEQEPEPIRSQMVIQAMNDLNSSLEEQSNLIQKLYEGVRIVLRTDKGEKESQMGEYKSESVPLADDIAALNNTTRNNNNALSNIISRLEI